MRIAHVNDVAFVASTLVHSLNALGHEAELIRLELAGGSRGTLAKLAYLPARIAEMGAVNRRIRERGYDVVHIHYAYVGTYGRIGRYPYFLHCHGTDVRRGLASRARRGLTLAAMRDARGVFFSTPDLAEQVRAVRPDARYLPNPVRTDLFRPARERGDGGPRILIVSSLSLVKGIETAFAAVGEVLRMRECRVTAIFSGPLRERYRDTPGVRFVDPVPHERMPELIAEADIVVGQFLLGSLGLAELESMACGKPVVTRVVPSPLYGSPPPVISAEDPSEAAAALVRLIDSRELRHTLGTEAAGWIAVHHDAAKVATELLDVYRT